MHLSNYLENKLIDWIFRGITPLGWPPSLYAALCTSTPTESQTGATIPEVVSPSYNRVQLPNDITAYFTSPVAGSGTTYYNFALNFRNTTPDANDWGTITSIAILDNVNHGAGNLLWYGDLVTPVRLEPFDRFTIPVGKLSFQIDA